MKIDLVIMKVVVVLPTYNEKENIEKIISILEEEVFPHIKNHDMNILVADDNSPDGTAGEVHKLMKKWKNLDINSGEKHGLGAAYIRGMTYAVDKMGADVMFEMDADGQHDPKKIPEFLKKIDEGYDLVIGTRYSSGGSIPHSWPLIRKTYSVMANIFVRTVFMKFSIHDWTGGYRALRKEVFLKLKKDLVNYNGYIFQISSLHKAVRMGFKIAEVPFHFRDRTLGTSKIGSIGYIFDVFSYVIIARIIELKRFIKFLVVGGTGFVLQLVVLKVLNYTGMNQTASTVISAEISILSNFLFNDIWTFKDTGKIAQHSGFLSRLVKFNIASLSAVVIEGAAIDIGVRLFGEKMSVLGYSLHTSEVILIPAIILLVIPTNYLIYNRFIWKTQYLKAAKAKAS